MAKRLCPSKDCFNFLHAAWKHAGKFFFTKYQKIQGAWKKFVEVQGSFHYFN